MIKEQKNIRPKLIFLYIIVVIIKAIIYKYIIIQHK
ncbi:hypothetical protein Thethe_01676 [Thermoanaerobacterium thermosaccharolyticum M0795]|uniref:Uncharacterized protein n=2 Tax=Thermoanaerobacterium thermosaccharolyticum TaxID=1517 RepID=D9TQ09_THETC|nr:hypothetical protein Tthe_1669 [Thermoanaerobacterium thermosaccharolyticum DSM 571]AGB19312.1 hypothetical protein Thethe_01676 [Thermoanaerobacterium thermosaccharolyticum M0795]